MNKRMSCTGLAVLAVAIAGGCASGEKHESVPMTAVPAAITAGVQKAFPGSTIREVEKETYPDGTVHWEVDLVTADGKKAEHEFDGSGQLLDKH